MSKKDETTAKKVLGTGAYGDPENPELGAPTAAPVFIEAPVEAPHALDKKESK